MENERELSDFKLQRHECPKCKAVWINGEHRWTGTGKPGSELDLAGLVCNKYGDDTCINPRRGEGGGDTWEYRRGFVDGAIEEKKKMLDKMKDVM
jgi:hypothetical protein